MADFTTSATLTRTQALEHFVSHFGVYQYEWEEGEPEPRKFEDMSNEELEAAFCLSGLFAHVFAEDDDVGENDLKIIDD